jgi:regulator of replication initiation timing
VSAVSAATAAALEEALRRLLEGRPARTDGALTIANLAREAGVSRATANRATDILTRFRARLGQDGGDLPATLRDRVRDLTAQVAELRRYEHQEVTSLRATVSTLAQHVQALTLENQALRDAIERDAGVARMSDRTPDRRGGADLILPAKQAADLTRMLATIDKFLRSDYADEALTAFLASQGTQNPGYHASILIDDVSFTELRFRQFLADGNAPQPPGPRPSEGAS